MQQTSAAQLASLTPGVTSTEVVPWQQVQGFLDMAESALRAKNAANTILLQEKALAAQALAQQPRQSRQEAVPGQAEDTAFLRQQLEALLRERAASKEMIAGLQREKGFLLDERELLFHELQSLDVPPDIVATEPARPDSQRVYRRAMTVGRWTHRLLEDSSQTREGAESSQGRRLFALEPATPPDANQDTRQTGAQGMVREQEDADTPNTENNPFQRGHMHAGSDEQQQANASSSVLDPANVFARSPLQVRPDIEQNALHSLQTCKDSSLVSNTVLVGL